MEAVARRFSTTWEKGDDWAGAYLEVAGKRVAVGIRALKRRGNGQGSAGKPGLRFDKVVNRLMERLQANLGDSVPDGVTVLVAVTAPIRLPSKTAAALEDKIQTVVGRGAGGRDEKSTIHGNRVRIRLLRVKSGRAPKMIGFVHDSDSDPLVLLDMTSELLQVIPCPPDSFSAVGGEPAGLQDARRGSERLNQPSTGLVSGEAGGRARGLAGDRWLVVICAGGSSWLEAYRYIYSQMRRTTDFQRILMVFGDGRVEVVRG